MVLHLLHIKPSCWEQNYIYNKFRENKDEVVGKKYFFERKYVKTSVWHPKKCAVPAHYCKTFASSGLSQKKLMFISPYRSLPL